MAVQIVLTTDSSIDGCPRLDSRQQLVQKLDEFDACVWHDTVDFPLISQLVEAGKRVLLDAPVVDVSELQQLATLDRNNTAIAKPNRFHPYSTSIEASKSKLGAPGLVRIHRWFVCNESEDSQQLLWRELLGQIDVACWLVQQPVAKVFAQTARDSVPGLLAHLTFSSCSALIDCVQRSGNAFYTISLIGQTGAAYGDDHRNTNLVMDRQGTLGTIVADGLWLGPQLMSFATDLSCSESIRSEIYATRIAHAAVQSACSNQVATIDENGERKLA